MKILSIILLVFFTSEFYAQGFAENQMHYANQLFESRNYFDAITEYKRLLFFDKSSQYEFSSFFKIGESYKFGGKWDEAAAYFSKAARSANDAAEKYQAEIEIVRVNILRRTTTRALQLIDKMETNPEYSNHKNDFFYWRGWAYMLADDWGNASKQFEAISDDHPLKRIADETENEKYSVTFAKVISYIVPGSGQFYSGHYLSGLMSLGWNILFGYLTTDAFISNRAFDGLTVGGLLWLRFYRGNVQNAEKFAVNKNLEISNKAYRYLKNNYKGIKP